MANPRPANPEIAPSPSSLQAWREFVQRYEEFTDLLCVSAKEGITQTREGGYARLRTWFLENYPRVAPRLHPFLLNSGAVGGGTVVMVDPVSGQRRPLDEFEVVFVSTTLDDLFRRDAGGLIDQISRLSEAVYCCEDSLSAGGA